jgi:hypothetical protein
VAGVCSEKDNYFQTGGKEVTTAQMNLNTHDHTRVPAEACPQKCIHRGMPKDAPAQAHPQRSACQGMSTQVHLQRHLKCTTTYMTTQLYLHGHVHVGEPTEACSCWCISRSPPTHAHPHMHTEAWQHRRV